MWETRNEFTPVESSFDVARGRGIRGGWFRAQCTCPYVPSINRFFDL